MRWFRRASTRPYSTLAPIPDGVAVAAFEAGLGAPRLRACRVHDGAGLDAKTSKALAQEAGVARARFGTLLDRSGYQILAVEAPEVPEEEVAKALRWKVKDLLDFPVEEAVIEYLRLPGNEAERTRRLYVLVARANAVRAAAAPFHEAKLDLAVIETRETAQRNLARLVAPEGYAVALLHFDGMQGLLTFSHGSDLILVRSFDGRGASLDVLHERLILEVQRSMDLFERQHRELPLAKLYLSTPSTEDGLTQRLAELLTVGTEYLDLSAHIDFAGFAEMKDARMQNRLFHVLGAALREGA